MWSLVQYCNLSFDIQYFERAGRSDRGNSHATRVFRKSGIVC